MKKIIFTALLFSSAWIMSCGNTGGDPKTTLSNFFDALSKKDIATARKFATEESKSMLDMMEMGMNMDKSSKDNDKYDKSKIEFGDAKIDGDKATIAVKEKGSGETMNFTMKKEKGAWKVAFDKASMMNMGMEKMKEKGMNPVDSLNKAMDDIKNMNTDSLKAGMEEGMKMLDSASKY
jgi:hypothetical protein